MREELEAAANITAGFDELHDIGSDNSAANDLLGDIYTPQWESAYQSIEKFMAKIGNLMMSLRGIFEKVGAAIHWCIENWKIFAGLIAAFVIAKSLFNLFNLLNQLGGVIGGLPALIHGAYTALGVLAGGLSVGYSIYEAYKLATKWDQMTDKEKDTTMAKSIGAGALGGAIIGGLVGGPLGAIIGAGLGTALSSGISAAIADYNGDEARMMLASKIGGAGLGATLGTMIGAGLGGPIGAALGAVIGTGLGTVLGDAIGKIDKFFLGAGGSFSNLKISEEDLKWATEQTVIAQEAQQKALIDLRSAEETTGYSGKALYDELQKGTITMDQLNSSQLLVVDAYKKYKDASDTVQEAIKRETDYKLAQEFQNAKLGKSYDQLVADMIKAKDDGIYTEEELTDRLSQLYAELGAKNRTLFMKAIPENMREGVKEGAQQYYSGWEKFKMGVSDGLGKFGTMLSEKWKALKNGAQQGWKNITDTISNWVKSLVSTVTGWFDGIVTAAQNMWQRIVNFFSGKGFKTNEQVDSDGNRKVSVAAYAVGTNYVPSDGLAYLHQGEAVIPKKYNKPFTTNNTGLENAIESLTKQVEQIGNKVDQGIDIKGQFVQKGSDLVATVQKVSSKLSNNVLNNKVYAR